jgi:carbonic anhydrase/acetyltransferase-like protein (isoleucine patch superfamily)
MGMQVPDGSMLMGRPARIVRSLQPDERAQLRFWADKYVANAAYCLKHRINVSGPLASGG